MFGVNEELVYRTRSSFSSTTDGEVLRRPEVELHRSDKHSHAHEHRQREAR